MAAKRFDLNKRCFFVISGLANTLGKSLAIEMCRRFKPGSVALLFEESEETLQSIKKEIQYLENNIEVICCPIGDWQTVDAAIFQQFLSEAVKNYATDYFEFAYILHNEGAGATQRLMEPDEAEMWKSYVQENLNVAVALNQTFLNLSNFAEVNKLVVNITSSLQVKPLIYSSLMCSCKKARDMYFRSMAAYEGQNRVAVLTYSPGILETHKPESDINNNIIDFQDLEVNMKLMKIPRVKPLQSTLKLINILQEMSFTSGHDVDYYDTYFL